MKNETLKGVLYPVLFVVACVVCYSAWLHGEQSAREREWQRTVNTVLPKSAPTPIRTIRLGVRRVQPALTPAPTPTAKPVSEQEKMFNRHGFTLEGGSQLVPPTAK